MATELERLTVSLEANLKSFEKAMAKANQISTRELRALEKGATASMGRLEKTFGGVGASLKANLGLAVAGALAGITAFARTAVSDAANIGDLADKIGLGTAELQGLQYGAVQANMSFDDLSNGLLKFSKAIGQARNGSGELLKTLEVNGFSKAEVQALSYSEALNIVADLIKNAKTEQDALLITMQAFGKGGDGFAEFLRNGSAGLAGFQADVREAGAIIDDALIRRAQVLDDKWAALMLSMKSNTQSAVLSIVDELTKAWNLGSNLISGNPMTGFMGRPIGTINQSAASTAPASGQVSAPGKSDLQRPTVIYDPQIDRDAAAAAAAKAAADRTAAAAAKARADQITNVINGLRFEGEQLKTNELQQRINTELRNAEVTATSAQGREIARLVTANYNLEASQRLVAEATSNYAERLEEVKNAQMEVARMGVDAFNRIAIGGEKVTDVLISLVDQLAQAAVNGALLGDGPLGTLFGTAGSGGLIGSLLGGGSTFSGFYAKGGQIPSGKFGITGEAGPELIKGPATVIPMNRNGGGARTSVTIVQNIHANGDKTVADIAFRETSRALRDYERQRPSIDIERRLRTA
jgi:hypothetical protein